MSTSQQRVLHLWLAVSTRVLPDGNEGIHSAMSMYRNRYFLAGILLVLLGIQFRMIDSFVLNEPATRALARVTKKTSVADTSSMSTLLLRVYPTPTKRVEPPRWLGLAMITVGAVISCHALAIPRQHRNE